MLSREKRGGRNVVKVTEWHTPLSHGKALRRSAVPFLRLARRAMSAAMAATVADIDTDAWQAKAAASNQYRSQYNGHGPDHHRSLRFHWNTPEFPNGAPKHRRATHSIHCCINGRQRILSATPLPSETKVSTARWDHRQQATIPTWNRLNLRDIPRRPFRTAAE